MKTNQKIGKKSRKKTTIEKKTEKKEKIAKK